jgi:aminoglycoside 6'-N-acetyltransferase
VGPVSYRFRPVAEPDLPLLRRWLATPEVRRWWGDPEREAAMMRDNLTDPAVAMWIVAYGGRPFAYAQDYDLHAWWPDHPFDGMPPGTRGIDQLIGEPDMIDRGHGSGFVRAHAGRLLAAGAPCVCTDPDPQNLRARRAYAKAGFVGDEVYQTPAGPAVLMIRRPVA